MPTPEDLAAFKGDWFSEEAGATLTFAVDGDKAFMKQRPATSLALQPLYKDHFQVPGHVVWFTRDKNGKVNDMHVGLSRVRDMPFVRISSQSNDDPKSVDGTGREVLAILRKIAEKAYTDDLGNGKVLVSDVFRFEVVEPKELTKVTVTAYHRGAPNIQRRRLQVGDHVRFELPPPVQREGILLQDLKGLRFGD
jgi:hypothetical protein